MHKKRWLKYVVMVIVLFVVFVTILIPVTRQVWKWALGWLSTNNFAILISSLALFVTLLNYIEKLKPSKIVTSLPEKIQIVKRDSKCPSDFFHIPVTFTNLGFNYAVITDCQIDIMDVSDKKVYSLAWETFCKSEGTKWTNESLVYPIPLNAKSSFSKIITFQDLKSNPFYLKSGEYEIILKIEYEGGTTLENSCKRKMTVTTQMESQNSSNGSGSHTLARLTK